MKKKLEFLNNSEINLEDFYCVTIYKFQIRLQAKNSSAIFKTYKNMGFEFEVDFSNGYFTGVKMFGDIAVSITLTLP